MTVSSETNKITYAGDGATTVFSTSFLFSANNEVSVVLIDSSGVETSWMEGTEYTLTGAGIGAAGTVTVDTSPTDYTPQVGETLVVRLAPAFLQQTALPRGGVISPVDIEAALDTLVRQNLRQNEISDRTVSAPITEDSFGALPALSDRASKVFAFDVGGQPIASIKTLAQLESEADNAAASAAAAATSESNALTSENNAATSEGNAATSEGDATNSAAAAAVSESNALTSENNAATSEGNAATSEGNAATSEGNASTSETNATNAAAAAATSEGNALASENNAATSEGNAATSEGNAATSEGNAATSAAAAAASASSGLFKDVVNVAFADSPYTITNAQDGDLFQVDTSGGSVVVNLPDLSSETADQRYAVAKMTGDANTVTVQAQGTDTINGVTSHVITDQYDVKNFIGDQSDGEWLLTIFTPGTGLIDTADIADNAVTLAKLEHGISGDILYYGAAGEPFRLAKGTDTQILTLASGLPSWADAAAGGGVPTGSVTSYLGTTAPTGWLLLNGDTLGSASSGATQASADNEDLFNLLWNNFADSEAAVSSGRGASAAADWSANKTIAIPDATGRTIFGKESSATRITSAETGVDGSVMGDSGGTEAHALAVAELASHAHSYTAPTGNATDVNSGQSTGSTATSTGSQGSGSTHTNLPPALILSWIVKV
jgi:hypothetical protein